MKQLVIVSGKGGTGKTSICSSLAAVAENATLADCDVDAANVGLLLGAETVESEPFEGGRVPILLEERCIQCGMCQEVCRFKAIDDQFRIDPFACEACGFCAHVCPNQAIEMRPRVSGELRVSSTRYGTLVHARLGVAEEYSGKLVAEVRNRALQLADEEGCNLIIADGPPGIGCPVISAVTGADLALVVTEPSVSGLHDLERVLRVIANFRIPAIAVINKYDINTEMSWAVEKRCTELDVPVVGRIPFDSSVARSLVNNQPPVLGATGPAAAAIRQVCEVVLRRFP